MTGRWRPSPSPRRAQAQYERERHRLTRAQRASLDLERAMQRFDTSLHRI